MRTRRIALSLLVIVLVIGVTAGLTYAYFGAVSGGKTVTLSTAKIEIGSVSGLPMTVANILPGETVARNVDVTNASTRAADLFFQMVAGGGSGNLCYTYTDASDLSTWQYVPVLWAKISDRNTGAVLYNNWICPTYAGQPGDLPGVAPTSVIPKLADDLAAGATAYLKVELTLASGAGNEYMNLSKTETMNFIAVQFDGPAPVPATTGFPTSMPAWPEGDTNY